MERFVQFAQKTVKAVSNISPFPISLSDEQGYIIGDTNSSRIGTLHKPSIEVLKVNHPILFDEEKTSKMDNVLPGVAVPLNIDYKAVGVLGIIGDPKEVEPYADLIKKYVEMMWQETIRTQIEELEVKTLETFVQYILLNETVSKKRVEQYCRLLQVNFSQIRLCILIDIRDSLLRNVQSKQHAFSLDHFKRTLLDCVRRAYGNDKDNLCTFLNTEKIVFLKAFHNNDEYHLMIEEFMGRSRQLLESFAVYHIDNVTIASGNKYDSIDQLNHSYQEAESLIQFGQKTSIKPEIYTYYNWQVLLEMFPYQISAEMLNKLLFRLKPLLQDEAFVQLKLDFLTYCDNNMNISKAAKELFIHRNTLIYRLKKIDAITMLDTTCFQHCTLLYLVLKNYRNL